MTGVLYAFDRKTPLRLKAKVYEAIIISALTYVSDGGEQQEGDCYQVERMLRGILGVSRRDHLQNEKIRRILHLSPIDEVMCSDRGRWFGHVQRTDANNVTRRIMDLAIPGTRRRVLPERT